MSKGGTMAVKPGKTKTKQWLKDKGHKSAEVEAKNWNSDKKIVQSLCELNGVTDEQYQAAKETK